MRIAAIRLYGVSLPVVGRGHRMASTTNKVLHSTVVEVQTDSGTRGIRRGCPLAACTNPSTCWGRGQRWRKSALP